MMDLAINKVATTLPDSQSPDTGGQAGKAGPSKFDKIQSQLKNSSGSGVSASDGVGSTSNASAVNRVGTQNGTVNVPDRVQQNLAASQHHLAQLKERIDAAPGASSELQSRLSSIEHQYTRLDSVAKAMPPNASPQQWLALQQQVYSMNENIGVLSKMVGQAVSGVKSVLQTQV
jgi:hypothetical protein